MNEIPVNSIGFVVIGRNEGARLKECLRSVLAISTQVAYADSGSRDGSAEVAERLGVAVVRMPADSRLTAARGRNTGYQKLRCCFPDCRFVQFLDGDCILQPGWIERALHFLAAHPDVAVVCGRRFEAHPEASIYNRICDREWDTRIGETNECGGDALVRCEAFDEVGGYRGELQAGEEPEMTARMRVAGWKIWRIDAMMTEHDASIHSFRQWWRRSQRGGFGYAQVWSTTGNLPQRLYFRQLRSAIVWAFALPLVVVILAVLTRERLTLLVLPLIYVIQFFRIGSRASGQGKWIAAWFLLLGKIPEAIGAIRFIVAGTRRRVPEYKG